MSRDDRFKLQYYAANQATKVRLVVAFGLLVGAGLLTLAYAIASGDDPATSAGERIAWTVLVVAAAIAFPGALLVYASCYVESIEAGGDEAIYYTLRLFGTRAHRIHVADIESHDRNAGKFSAGSSSAGPIVPRVDAPWVSVRVRDRRLPFIIDGQGFYVRWKTDSEFDLEKAF